MQSKLYLKTLHPRSKFQPKCSCIDSHLCLVSIILIIITCWERKISLMKKSCATNCMEIIKCFANQFCNLNFIKHRMTNVLSSSTLPTLLQKWGAIYKPKLLWNLKSEIISLHFTNFTIISLCRHHVPLLVNIIHYGK
jgi:hypothetical protein